MASKSRTACLRALRQHPCSFYQVHSNRSQTFVTSPSFYAVLQERNSEPTTSIPPVHPQRVEGGPNSTISPSVLKAAAQLQRVTGRATATYTVYGITENMIKECVKQADYTIPQASDQNAEMPKTEDGEDFGFGSGWWHTEVGLKPTFSTWSQVTMLHMYILVVRFRCLPEPQARTWQQHLIDHFFYDAENKMTINHNMHARGTRNRYLKDLFIQWRGLLAAYDEGLVKGDPVLAAAIWRNIFKANADVDIKRVAMIVSYMRRTLHGLDALSDESLQFEAIKFGDPGMENMLVTQRSKMMDLTLKNGNVINELGKT